ncbi:MAG TPA: site-specific integrase [Bryobacteraceae bacterium]|nr:site-specific integrase [Bryobacteraceae bacterium]
MAVYKRGRVWWYKFTWKGEPIRESTKQTNKRVAEQIEAAHKTSLAKGEVGIRDRKPAPTIQQFAENDFLPFCRSTFAGKPNTLGYYENGTARLLEFPQIADVSLDIITAERITSYARRRLDGGLSIATVNRELQVLRRMFVLAMEWGKVERRLPRVRMIPGEAHRDRVLTLDEERSYLDAAEARGAATIEAYERALVGIRATLRDEQPIKPDDPHRLRDVATLLIDCALRSEECFRLRWENVRDAALHILFGKTASARRVIPLTARAAAILEMRRATAARSDWVFPAPTKSGHIEKSTLKKQHPNACKLAKIAQFPLYTFRHTCLTRWAAYMDPYTLAYLAGHSDFSTTRRYVHPQAHSVRAAMERAQAGESGHSSGHTSETRIAAPQLPAALAS